MLHCNCLEAGFDCSIEIETSPVHDFVQSFLVEEEFDSTEYRFNRVELWGIGHVPDGHDIQFIVKRIDYFGFVDGQIIH